MQLSVYTDGGSRGNPGPSGFGVAIYDHQKNLIAQISKFIGIKTNNESEYTALVVALDWINNHQSELDINSVDIFSDSQLLVRQQQGRYKVKSPNIVPLNNLVKTLINATTITYKFHEIPRELNVLADQLANQAMDRK